MLPVGALSLRKPDERYNRMDMSQAKEQKAMKGNKDLLTKKFGKHGPEVPGLGFGCMGLSGAFAKQKPDDERYAVLDHAYQSGVYLWDTADAYADSEDLLGRYVFLS